MVSMVRALARLARCRWKDWEFSGGELRGVFAVLELELERLLGRTTSVWSMSGSVSVVPAVASMSTEYMLGSLVPRKLGPSRTYGADSSGPRMLDRGGVPADVTEKREEWAEESSGRTEMK